MASTAVHAGDGPPDRRSFRIHRGDLAVLVNLSSEPVAFDVDVAGTVLLATDAVDTREGSVTLRAESAAITGPAF